MGIVGAADAGEDTSLVVADVEVEFQELVGAVDELRRRDLRDAQVDLLEFLDADRVGLLRVGVGTRGRFGGLGPCRLDHLV